MLSKSGANLYYSLHNNIHKPSLLHMPHPNTLDYFTRTKINFRGAYFGTKLLLQKQLSRNATVTILFAKERRAFK